MSNEYNNPKNTYIFRDGYGKIRLTAGNKEKITINKIAEANKNLKLSDIQRGIERIISNPEFQEGMDKINNKNQE